MHPNKRGKTPHIPTTLDTAFIIQSFKEKNTYSSILSINLLIINFSSSHLKQGEPFSEVLRLNHDVSGPAALFSLHPS